MLKYEDGPIFNFSRARRVGLSWFPGFVNGQRIYGNFKAKTPCQTRLNIWRKRTMFPWVRDTKPSFETKTSSLRSFQYKILEIYWCTFQASERTKLKPGQGGALSQGYNISLLCLKFKITSKGLPASKWVTVTQEPNTELTAGETFHSVILSHQKNSWGFKRETYFLLSFGHCQPG